LARLFTFGCSHTYGHGLADCNVKGHPGDKPSRLGYATILANSLDRKVMNFGIPGASNKQILWKLIQKLPNIHPVADTVVIQWSYVERNMIWQEQMDNLAAGPIEQMITPWGPDKRSKIWFKHINTLVDDMLNSALYVNHAYLLLSRADIKFVMIKPPDDSNSKHRHWGIFDRALLSEIDLEELNVTDVAIDKATDGVHSGPISNKNYAELLYNKYKDILQ